MYTPPSGLPFEELWNDHGGSDRNGDAYPVGSARYTYEVGSGAQALVRAASGDIIHNQAGFDNVHLRYTGPGALNGGEQYVEGTVANLGSGIEIPELYVRHGTGGTAVWLSTTTLQLFDWTGSAANGIDSADVSLSVGGPHTFWVHVTAAGVVTAGVLGLGVLIPAQSPASVRASGGHGFGWFRPIGTGLIPFTRHLFGTTRPAYVV